MIYLNATNLAVELAVVDIEGKRLSERPFNVGLELFHLFGDLKKRQLVTLCTLSFTRCTWTGFLSKTNFIRSVSWRTKILM